MLPHYLVKVRSLSFGISGRKSKRICNMHWFSNTHPLLMHLAYLLTCCFNFRLLLYILCKYQTIFFYTSVVNWSSVFCMFGMALTRPSLTVYWRVAWTSSRMHAGIRQTLWATIVTIFSHITRGISVFVKYDKIFRLFFLEFTTNLNF